MAVNTYRGGRGQMYKQQFGVETHFQCCAATTREYGMVLSVQNVNISLLLLVVESIFTYGNAYVWITARNID